VKEDRALTVPPSDLQQDVGSVSVDTPLAGTVEEPTDGTPAAKQIAGRSPFQLAWTRLKHDKVSMIALVVIILAVLIAIAAPFLRVAGVLDPYSYHDNLLGNFSIPKGSFGGVTLKHPFGVDPSTGRDIFSRVLLGISFSLLIATSATLLSVVLGATLGIISGYAGKATDYWISRFMDLVLSFPQLLMLLALGPVISSRIGSIIGDPSGNGTSTRAAYLILVLGFFGWPYLARIVRGQVLTLRNREFIEAAQSLGASRRRIWFRELLPNLWAPIIVYASLTLPLNISAEAALSYLGVGLQAPTPSLGNILQDSVSYYSADPTYFFVPGVALVLIVLAFNMFGDGLRDALDPKSNR
jgi:peptide/nickel transport system permease protein